MGAQHTCARARPHRRVSDFPPAGHGATAALHAAPVRRRRQDRPPRAARVLRWGHATATTRARGGMESRGRVGGCRLACLREGGKRVGDVCERLHIVAQKRKRWRRAGAASGEGHRPRLPVCGKVAGRRRSRNQDSGPRPAPACERERDVCVRADVEQGEASVQVDMQETGAGSG